MRWIAPLVVALAFAMPAHAQSPQSQARADGKAFGENAGKGAEAIADDEANASANLPGYNGGNAPERAYENNSGALDAAKITAAGLPESRLVIDGSTSRPQVPPGQVTSTTARGEIINQDPATYARGVDPQGTTGQCVELPPGGSSPGTFEATCNVGEQVINEPRTCNVPLDVTATSTQVYDYTCGEEPFRGIRPCDPNFTPRIGGSCTITGTRRQFICRQGTINNCTEPDWITINTLECDAPVPGEVVPVPRDVVSVTAVKNESICAAATQGLTCTNPVEVCTDPTPTTRMINNVPVTQACWGWERTSQCQGTKPGGNDCSALEANPACQFNRTECLDDPQVGPCKVENRIYTCPIPGNTVGEKQYLCGGDLYCVGGECEAVTREASDEFKDAAVGLETLAQVNREFSDVDFKLFKGTAMSCHKPIFGLVNCCAGKSSGLLTGGAAAAATAALSGGAGAIAGVATQFLVLFLCSPSEMELDVRDRLGLCHDVGWYCSGSFLGICHTRRRSSCCFLSKLTRVLQEQGRAQLSKSWGTAKKPDCSGFTIDEFALLDLSKMDFAEVYKEFVDAAKVPDESATMTDIQAKIRAYYSRKGI